MSDTITNLIHPQQIAEMWGLPLYAAGCPKCGVAHLIHTDLSKLEPDEKGTVRCPACFAAWLEPQPARLRAESPELAIPFHISPTQAAQKLGEWADGAPFRPSELDAATLSRRLTKTYLPMWLVDGEVKGNWQAEAGYDYEVASSQESYQSGQWHTRETTETRIKWEQRAGQVERSYQNVPVPALEAHRALMGKLGRYPLEGGDEYDPAILEDTSVRIPNLLPEAAWPLARPALEAEAAEDCQQAADAQHIEQFNLQAEHHNPNWTQLLLPVYTTAYRDDEGKFIPVMVNGYTGQVSGLKRASQKKAWLWGGGLGAAALLCFILAGAFTLSAALFPPMIVLSGLLFIASLGLGLAAPFPVVWAWRFNQREGP